MDFYPLFFIIARQIAASIIILYAYSFLQENNKKKYYFFVYVLLAASIHLSSIFYVLLFWIGKVKLDWFSEHIKITILLAIMLFFAVQLNKSLLLTYFFSHINISSVYEHLAVETLQSEVSVVGAAVTILEFVALLICFRLLYRNGERLLAKLLFVAVLFTIILSAYYGNVARLRLGITIIEPIALATIFSNRPYFSKEQLALFLMISLIFGYATLSSLSKGNYDIIPFYLSK